MKYLILTASTGGGHNQAANNLKKEIEKENNKCIIYDLFKDKHNNDFLFVKGYELLATSIPDFYGLIYNLSNNELTNPFILKNIFLHIAFDIKKILDIEKPNIIIATHPFAVPIVSRIKKLFKIKIPFIQIVTDFKAHYSYVDKQVDAYITASEYTKIDIVNKGINENKVFTYGIPINEEFREINKKEITNFNILIMGGSLGLKNMENSIDVLINSNLNVFLTIVCGNNIKLQKKLVEKYKRKIIDGKLKILGFTNNISELMDNSKLLITKPGGLTSSEAISKCLPMIIPFSIPGQETENTAFLVESNMALEIKKISDLPKYVKLLLENDDYYDSMIENMKNISKNYSTKSIIELAEKLVNNKNQ